jgi:hypothetical protein
VRALWDLTERWTLPIGGDYGGCGIDHTRATWQAFDGVGYRLHIRGVRTNLQVRCRVLGINVEESGVRP